MRLEHPAALALVLFVGLLIFLSRRTVHAKRTVGNLYLWHEATSTDAGALTRRIRRHWLLILQALFVCAVAAAIARPMLDIEAPVTLVVDASASMGAREGGVTRMTMARARAESLLESMPGDRRVRIVAAGPSPRAIGEFDASSATAGLDLVAVTDATADLPAAIDYARAADRRSAGIYVLTDADRTRVPGAAAPDVVWLPVGGPVDNAAVTHVSTRALDAPGRMQVLVRLANHGASAVNAPLILAHGAAEVVRLNIAIAPGAETSQSFVLPSSPGVLTARLEHDDARASDNVRRLFVPVEKRIRVSSPTARSVFLRQALAAQAEVVLALSPTSPADVIVCDGCTDLPRQETAGDANVLLLPPRQPDAEAPRRLVLIAGNDVLADALEFEGVDAVVLNGGPLPAGSRVIVQAGGVPAVIAYRDGSRRVVEIRVDPDSGTLPFSPALPLLVSNAVHWLASQDAPPGALTAGEPLQWNFGTTRQRPTVVGPDETVVDSSWANGTLSIADMHRAGVYTIRADGADVTIAVNPAVDGESDLSIASLPSASDGAEASALAGGAAGPAATAERDVSTILTLGALILLALEWRHRCTAAGTA